jgi:hypothetical protein
MTAWFSGKDATLAIGGANVSPDVDTIGLKVSAVTQTWQGLSTPWPVELDTGLRTATLAVTGLYGGTVGSPATLANVGSTPAVMLAHEGGTAGSRAFCLPASILADNELGITNKAMDTVKPALAISGAVHLSQVIAPLTARSAAGNTDTAYADLGASTTTGMLHVQVPALTLGGYTNCTLTLRSSADHVTFVNASPAITVVAPGAWSVAITGTVQRYVSLAWAWTGSGSGQSITALAAASGD